MMEECDFLKEAENIRKFDAFLKKTGNESAVVPKVYPHATTLRVLTMERLHGVPFTNPDDLRQYVPQPEDALVSALNTWFSSLVFCDFFHADVHAGNLLVLPDGRIGFIDFGIVGSLSPDTWSAMIALMEAIEEGDYQTIADSMLMIGVTRKKVDTKRLALDLRKLFGGLDTLEPQEAEINNLMLEIVALGERYGLHFPREFALLLKQFLYFDRYVHILAPDMNMFGDQRVNLMPPTPLPRTT
jgi:predicted unusual protein kinase regulating ubiquinone biosynthesis (AarF/ABC1/UbiB family)